MVFNQTFLLFIVWRESVASSNLNHGVQSLASLFGDAPIASSTMFGSVLLYLFKSVFAASIPARVKTFTYSCVLPDAASMQKERF